MAEAVVAFEVFSILCSVAHLSGCSIKEILNKLKGALPAGNAAPLNEKLLPLERALKSAEEQGGASDDELMHRMEIFLRTTMHDLRSSAAYESRRLDFIGDRAAVDLAIEPMMKYYYQDESPLRDGLRVYEGKCDGKAFGSVLVTKPEWMSLAVPLDPDMSAAKFNFDDSAESPILPKALFAQDGYFRALNLLWLQALNIGRGASYCLTGIDVQRESLRATFALSDFLAYRVTTQLCREDLLWSLRRYAKQPASLMKVKCGDQRMCQLVARELVVRKTLLPSDALADFAGRACLGGIHAVVALKFKNSYLIPIGRRSESVAHGQGRTVTIPTGYHQCFVDKYMEVNLYWTVLREIFEELFGGKEVERGTSHFRFDWYADQEEPIRWLFSNPRHVQVIVTCFGVNLEIGNYEFGILVIVDDDDFYTRYSSRMRCNWEFSPELGQPFLDTKDQGAIGEMLLQENWEHQNRPALVEALRWIQKNRSASISLPELTVDP